MLSKQEQLQSFKATEKEKNIPFRGGIFQDFVRDTRVRVRVCDCAKAHQAILGQDPPRFKDLQSKDNAFTEIEVQALPDGSCPYCGYHTKLVVKTDAHATATRRTA